MINQEQNLKKIEQINRNIRFYKGISIAAGTICILRGLVAINQLSLGNNIEFIESAVAAFAMAELAIGDYKGNKISNRAKQKFEQADLTNDNEYRINELNTNIESYKNIIEMCTGVSSAFAVQTIIKIISASTGNKTTLAGAMITTGMLSIAYIITALDFNKLLKADQRSLEIEEEFERLSEESKEDERLLLK